MQDVGVDIFLSKFTFLNFKFCTGNFARSIKPKIFSKQFSTQIYVIMTSLVV